MRDYTRASNVPDKCVRLMDHNSWISKSRIIKALRARMASKQAMTMVKVAASFTSYWTEQDMPIQGWALWNKGFVFVC